MTAGATAATGVLDDLGTGILAARTSMRGGGGGVGKEEGKTRGMADEMNAREIETHPISTPRLKQGHRVGAMQPRRRPLLPTSLTGPVVTSGCTGLLTPVARVGVGVGDGAAAVAAAEGEVGGTVHRGTSLGLSTA